MKTFVKRYFETEEALHKSLKLFEDSGFFSNHEIENLGDYIVLHGQSKVDLFTMKTKFADALTIKETT